MEEKILEEEDIEGLINLLQSSDTDACSMGLMILENCDHARSLPWLLVLFRVGGYEIRITISKHEQSRVVWNYLSKILNIEEAPREFTTEDCHKALKKCARNEAALAYIERDYAKKLRLQMIRWGYEFLKDFDLTLTKREDASTTG